MAGNDPHASDSNNGLYPTYQSGQDGPWQTIRHAAEMMFAGDTTFLRAGIYFEAGIVFSNTGELDKPIALINYPNEVVIIDGFQTEGEIPGIVMQAGRDHYLIQGLTIRNMPWSGIATDGETTNPYHDVSIRDCILYDNGWSGIDLSAAYGFLLENVEAYGNSFYGVNISGSANGLLSAINSVVRNGNFHDQIGKEGHGLAINQGHHILVSDSQAFHNRIHGFDVSDWPKKGELSYDIVLERNRSYDNGHAGFSINSDSHHVVYRNNIAWGNGAAWSKEDSSSGFLCYEGCWHVEWLNNVSVGNSDAGFYIEDDLGRYGSPKDKLLIFKNNISYLNGQPDWEERSALVVMGNQWEVVAMHNNWGGAPEVNAKVVGMHIVDERGEIYTRDEVNRGVFQTGNLSIDPMFMDIETGNWVLQLGSHMIDSGIDVGLPFCGAAPDLGALEICP